MGKGREHLALGRWGEAAAAAFLIKKEYRILERNYSVPQGEIDIIAKDPFGVLLFIEVKTRYEDDGDGERANSKKKQACNLRAAKMYCLVHGIPVDRTPMRFEHVTVIVLKETKKVRFRKYIVPIG